MYLGLRGSPGILKVPEIRDGELVISLDLH